jgi:hypothetical protein
MVTVTHTFVSPVVDEGTSTEVGPSEWNADHEVVDANIFGVSDDVAVGRDTVAEFGIPDQFPVKLEVDASVETHWHQRWGAYGSGSDGVSLIASKSRGTDADDFTSADVQDNDLIFNLLVYGMADNTWEQCGQMFWYADGTITQDRLPSSFGIATRREASHEVAERFQIFSTGQTQIRDVTFDETSVNRLLNLQSVVHVTTVDPPVNGVGVGFTMSQETSDNNVEQIVAIDAEVTDVTLGSEDAKLRLYTMTAGALAEVAAFQKTATATHTSLLLYDVDNNTVERVTVGAADSGGSGFKVLRIPN